MHIRKIAYVFVNALVVVLMCVVVQMLSSVSEVFPWGDSNREGLHLVAIPYVMNPGILVLLVGSWLLYPQKTLLFLVLLVLPFVQLLLVLSAELTDQMVLTLVIIGVLFIGLNVRETILQIRRPFTSTSFPE